MGHREMKRRKFKVYRWWVGGKWAFMDGLWWRAGANDFVIENGVGFHFTYTGIKKREDYTK